ncbi:hydroxyacylglutathione hydrolase [Spirochaetota bacterium]
MKKISLDNIIPIRAFGDNYIWLITNPEKTRGIVFDPGSAQPVLSYLENNNIELCGICITHHHMDHTGGVSGLRSKYKVPVYGGAGDGIGGLTNPLKENDTIRFDEIDLSLRVIETPGHTRGHVVYYAEKTNPPLLFSGDALFLAGCGRVFEGTFDGMYGSLLKLKKLPRETLIFCAHEYTLSNLNFASAVEPGNKEILNRSKEVSQMVSNGRPSVPGSVEEDLATNPFLRCDIMDVKNAAQKHSGGTLNSESAIFAVLRSWKDSF